MGQVAALPVAILLLIIALVLLWLARRQKAKSGLPGGKLIYVDTQGWRRVERPLYCSELCLTGRPDYLVEHEGQIYPVEVKSSTQVNTPYEAHILQLGAYCVLVERSYGKRPAHGILRYPGKTYAVDFTPELEEQVLSLVSEMQARAGDDQLNRSHESPQRCARCGYRGICDQALRI